MGTMLALLSVVHNCCAVILNLENHELFDVNKYSEIPLAASVMISPKDLLDLAREGSQTLRSRLVLEYPYAVLRME